jgi:hypothetical protein
VDARTAYVLSIGSGAASRLYKTTDGGATLTVVPPPGLAGFRSPVTYVEPAGFRRVLAVGPSGVDQ